MSDGIRDGGYPDDSPYPSSREPEPSFPKIVFTVIRKHFASVGRNPEGQDAEERLDAKHEHAVGKAETPARSRQSNKPGREM